MGNRQVSRADCIVEEDSQAFKLVSSDNVLSRLEESVVNDIEMERRMATLRSTSRGV